MRYLLDGTAVIWEDGRNGSLLGINPADPSVIRVLETQNQRSKGLDRTMKKIVVPYSYTNAQGGTTVKSLTFHSVVTCAVPENPDEQNAQDLALLDALQHYEALEASASSGPQAVATRRIQVGLSPVTNDMLAP